MKKENKKLNPHTKRNLIQARVDTEEMQIILERALVYFDGDISKWVRYACLNHKPVTKRKLGK